MELQNTLANLYTTPYQSDPDVESAPISTLLIFEAIGSFQWGDHLVASIDPRFVTQDGSFWFELYLHVKFHCDFRATIVSDPRKQQAR